MSDNLSIAFQIKDDLLNISPSAVSDSKGMLGEDIFEGKQSLMVIHSLHQRNNQNDAAKSDRLKEILHKKTKDPTLIKEAISILSDLGSIKFAEGKMNEFFEKSLSMCKDLNSIAVNKEATGDIEELAKYLINRV